MSLQHKLKLYDAMDDAELRARIVMRRKARRQRTRSFLATMALQNRELREVERTRRSDECQRRWHARARAILHCVAHPEATTETRTTTAMDRERGAAQSSMLRCSELAAAGTTWDI